MASKYDKEITDDASTQENRHFVSFLGRTNGGTESGLRRVRAIPSRNKNASFLKSYRSLNSSNVRGTEWPLNIEKRVGMIILHSSLADTKRSWAGRNPVAEVPRRDADCNACFQ
jgi:hypothetical protein